MVQRRMPKNEGWDLDDPIAVLKSLSEIRVSVCGTSFYDLPTRIPRELVSAIMSIYSFKTKTAGVQLSEKVPTNPDWLAIRRNELYVFPENCGIDDFSTDCLGEWTRRDIVVSHYYQTEYDDDQDYIHTTKRLAEYMMWNFFYTHPLYKHLRKEVYQMTRRMDDGDEGPTVSCIIMVYSNTTAKKMTGPYPEQEEANLLGLVEPIRGYYSLLNPLEWYNGMEISKAAKEIAKVEHKPVVKAKPVIKGKPGKRAKEEEEEEEEAEAEAEGIEEAKAEAEAEVEIEAEGKTEGEAEGVEQEAEEEEEEEEEVEPVIQEEYQHNGLEVYEYENKENDEKDPEDLKRTKWLMAMTFQEFQEKLLAMCTNSDTQPFFPLTTFRIQTMLLIRIASSYIKNDHNLPLLDSALDHPVATQTNEVYPFYPKIRFYKVESDVFGKWDKEKMRVIPLKVDENGELAICSIMEAKYMAEELAKKHKEHPGMLKVIMRFTLAQQPRIQQLVTLCCYMRNSKIME